MTEPRLPGSGRARVLLPAAAFAALLLVPPTIALAVLAAAASWRVGRWLAAGGLAARRRARAGLGDREGPGVVLGISPSGRTVVIPDRALAAHSLIVGASGSGKSTTMVTILSDQIARGRPVVAIDLKGSPGFAQELRGAAADAGVGFQLWTPDGGAHWNPLATGNATELKDKLIATERFTEPHYQRAAERYLQAAIRVLQESRPEAQLSLGALVSVLDPQRLAGALRGLPAPRREQVRDYLSGLTGDQLSAIRGLATRLAVLSESHTGPFLEPRADAPAIDLRSALDPAPEAGAVVLFSLNSSTYGRLSSQLGTLAVQDLVAAAGARLASGGRPAPAVVAIDEFSALGSENVLALLARGREAGIGVLLATQELADLDRAAPGLRDQVLGNTAVKIAHRQDVPASATAVARMGGTFREWERSYQQELSPLRRGRPTRANLRLVDRYAIEPDRIQSLAPGEAAVIVKSPRARTMLARVVRRTPPSREGPAR